MRLRLLALCLALFGVGALLLALYFYLNSGLAVTVITAGATQVVQTRAATVGAALREAGYTLYPEDQVSPPLTTPLTMPLTIVLNRAPVVRIEVAGQTRLVRARSPAPAAIVQAAGFSLGPADSLWADGALVSPAAPERPVAPAQIEIRRALTVTVSENGGSVPLLTSARTVGEALWLAGYRLYRADHVQPPLDTPLQPALTLTLQRSQPITIQADGRALSARTQQATVGAALVEAGLALVGEDYAVPDERQPLPPEGVIRVVRVRELEIVENESLPFETVYQALPEVEIDTPLALVQAGGYGLKQRRTRVRYEDGVEVSRVVVGEALVQPPVNRVMGYGTRIVIRSLATSGGAVEYWRAYTMYATSYAAKYLGGSNITASGMKLTKGIVAIDRRYVPFYTQMYVPGYGLAVAGDTGGGVKGRWIDLGFDDWNYEGWHQVVTVYFLTPVPALDKIVWVIPQTVP